MTDQVQLTDLQAKLTRLRALGVFYLVPSIELRPDGKGKWLVFRKRGRVICDPNARYKRSLGLPKHDPDRVKKIFEKVERTKEAARLVKQINDLTTRKEKQAQVASQVKIYLEMAESLRRRAAEYESKAQQLSAVPEYVT